jgi:hypothetical protein
MRSVAGISNEAVNLQNFRIPIDLKLYEFPFEPKNNNKEKLNVLFSGCSITYGESIEKKDVWAWKVCEKIKNELKIDCEYNNVAAPGMSISESIDQVFRYCYNYGNPDVIFILFPGYGRDIKYVNKEVVFDGIKTLNFISYFYLYQYCQSLNIKLITSTWFINKELINKELLPEGQEGFCLNYKSLDWGNQLYDKKTNPQNFMNEIFNQFDTYYTYSEEKLIDSIYTFDKNKDKLDKKYSIVAKDKKHPGTSFHDFWAEFMFEKYKQIL